MKNKMKNKIEDKIEIEGIHSDCPHEVLSDVTIGDTECRDGNTSGSDCELCWEKYTDRVRFKKMANCSEKEIEKRSLGVRMMVMENELVAKSGMSDVLTLVPVGTEFEKSSPSPVVEVKGLKNIIVIEQISGFVSAMWQCKGA